MGKRIAASLLLLVLLLVQPLAFADSLQEVSVRQIYLYQDSLHAYVDIKTESGSPVAAPDTRNVLAYLDGNKLSNKNIQTFSESGEGMAYIFLVDISGSLSPAQFRQMQDATKNWAEKMEAKDRLAIVTFGNDCATVLDFTDDKSAILQTIDSLSNHDGSTRLYGGLEEAVKLATRNDTGLPKRKAILLLTDGMNEFSGGIDQAGVLAQVKDALIPVYSVWSGGSKAAKGQEFLTTVSDFSRGELFDLSKSSVEDIYSTTYLNLHQSFVLDFSYPSASADGKSHNYKISVREEAKEASDALDFIMNTPTEMLALIPLTAANNSGDSGEKERGMSNLTLIGLIALGVFFVAIIIIVIAVLFGRGKKVQAPPPVHQNVITPDMANVPPAPVPSASTAPPAPKSRPASGGLPVILTELGGTEVRQIKVGAATLVGRSPECDVVLSDSQVSSRHCTLYAESGALLIEDQHSTNGTIVNGLVITSKTPLEDGDLLLLGSKEYRISY